MYKLYGIIISTSNTPSIFLICTPHNTIYFQFWNITSNISQWKQWKPLAFLNIYICKFWPMLPHVWKRAMSFNQKSFNLPYKIIYIHYDVIAYHIIYHLYIIELIKRTKGKKKYDLMNISNSLYWLRNWILF